MNIKEIEKIEKSVLNNLAVENILPSQSAIQITRGFLEGRYDSKTAIDRIKNTYLNKL